MLREICLIDLAFLRVLDKYIIKVFETTGFELSI